MRRAFLLSILLVLLFCGLVARADAVILDFDSLPTGTFTELIEDGFKIRYIGFGDLQTVVDIGGGNHVLKDSAYNMYGAEVYITSLDGCNFYFNSLDYNNFNNNTGLFRIDVGAFPDPFDWGTATSVQLQPTSSTFSTLTSGDLGVDAIELCQLRVNLVSYTADYSVDNIDLSPVPEPATMLLLGSGLIGLAAFRKRFRRS